MFYKIEEMIRDKSPEERYEERQKQAKPLLEAFFEWLHTLEDAVDRSSKIGEAVLYTPVSYTHLHSPFRGVCPLVVRRWDWLLSKPHTHRPALLLR